MRRWKWGVGTSFILPKYVLNLQLRAPKWPQGLPQNGSNSLKTRVLFPEKRERNTSINPISSSDVTDLTRKTPNPAKLKRHEALILKGGAGKRARAVKCGAAERPGAGQCWQRSSMKDFCSRSLRAWGYLEEQTVWQLTAWTGKISSSSQRHTRRTAAFTLYPPYLDVRACVNSKSILNMICDIYSNIKLDIY